ncbi:hypothetical protein OH693_14530 [Escherichia coli]|nr:hypothetical protein [Escherichia coli]
MLYCQFNGRNMEELRRQYRLSQPQIYQIIARQRKLHTRRHQPDLFSPETPKITGILPVISCHHNPAPAT